MKETFLNWGLSAAEYEAIYILPTLQITALEKIFQAIDFFTDRTAAAAPGEMKAREKEIEEEGKGQFARIPYRLDAQTITALEKWRHLPTLERKYIFQMIKDEGQREEQDREQFLDYARQRDERDAITGAADGGQYAKPY